MSLHNILFWDYLSFHNLDTILINVLYLIFSRSVPLELRNNLKRFKRG